MTDDDFKKAATESISTLLAFVVSSERIRAVMPIVKLAAEELVGLVKIDPELKPEVMAALDHLQEANETLSRAFDFASARMNAKLEKL
jgi:uncharacterized protein (DUF1778 family)